MCITEVLVLLLHVLLLLTFDFKQLLHQPYCRNGFPVYWNRRLAILFPNGAHLDESSWYRVFQSILELNGVIAVLHLHCLHHSQISFWI